MLRGIRESDRPALATATSSSFLGGHVEGTESIGLRGGCPADLAVAVMGTLSPFFVGSGEGTPGDTGTRFCYGGSRGPGFGGV